MGSTFVMGCLGLFTLAIGQGIVRRIRNPFGDVAYETLSHELQTEVVRLLPGFVPGPARLTQQGDEAKVEGLYQGERRFEIKGFAGDWKWEITVSESGRLLELEKEKRRSAR